MEDHKYSSALNAFKSVKLHDDTLKFSEMCKNSNDPEMARFAESLLKLAANIVKISVEIAVINSKITE